MDYHAGETELVTGPALLLYGRANTKPAEYTATALGSFGPDRHNGSGATPQKTAQGPSGIGPTAATPCPEGPWVEAVQAATNRGSQVHAEHRPASGQREHGEHDQQWRGRAEAACPEQPAHPPSLGVATPSPPDRPPPTPPPRGARGCGRRAAVGRAGRGEGVEGGKQRKSQGVWEIHTGKGWGSRLLSRGVAW